MKASSKFRSGESKRSIVTLKKSQAAKANQKVGQSFEPMVPEYLKILPPVLKPKKVTHDRKRRKILEVIAMPEIDSQTALISVTFEDDA